MPINSTTFGALPDGREVKLFTLTNGTMIVKITNYGGIITELLVPDRNGKLNDVVLGFDSLDPYLNNHPYFGCIVGRYANRISQGRFTLDGKEYHLSVNDHNHHLHGGMKGYDKKLWQAEPNSSSGTDTLALKYFSPDGEEGYPGNFQVIVIYSLTKKNELQISCEAITDKPTIVNLSNHGYVNFSGSDTVLNHQILINADRYTVVDDELIPTGELRSVENSPMDFRSLKLIGSRIHEVKGGYDHNYVLNKSGNELSFAALVVEPFTGRAMELWTTEPGIQFYSANFLDGTITGKGKKRYLQHGGFCLEPQRFPDSPNHPAFPSAVLRPGETYLQTSIYKFFNRD